MIRTEIIADNPQEYIAQLVQLASITAAGMQALQQAGVPISPAASNTSTAPSNPSNGLAEKNVPTMEAVSADEPARPRRGRPPKTIEVKPIKLEDISKRIGDLIIAEKAAGRGNERVKELLAQFDAASASKIVPERWEQFMQTSAAYLEKAKADAPDPNDEIGL